MKEVLRFALSSRGKTFVGGVLADTGSIKNGDWTKLN